MQVFKVFCENIHMTFHFRSKVQAQRKFAQGSINYTYSTTKIVSKTRENVFQSFQSSQQISDLDNEERELNNFSRLPSVDDFLTFLCFRGELFHIYILYLLFQSIRTKSFSFLFHM